MRIETYARLFDDFTLLGMGEGFSPELILSKRRDRPLVNARQHIAVGLREKGYSYPQIGRVMNRHHTSIMHLCKWRRDYAA